MLTALMMRITALSLAVWLAGCTTAPSLQTMPSAAPVSSPVLTGSPATPTPAPKEAGPGLAAVVPPDATLPPGLPAAESSRPALLAGEAAREFERGGASWYGPGFHGRRTASGERYDMHALTAAHRTLPFGTVVRVHSLVNGREVDVRITDRGPFSRNRVIDVSRTAAEALGMLGLGFKEVVLLVPESTLAVSVLPQLPARKPKPWRHTR